MKEKNLTPSKSAYKPITDRQYQRITDENKKRSRKKSGYAVFSQKSGSSSLGNITDFAGTEYQAFTASRAWLYQTRQTIHDFIYSDMGGSSRVTFCGSAVENISINLAPTQKAFISGVAKCGNRWICPNCSTKINTALGVNLKTAFELYKGQGKYMSFVTLTLRHNKTQKLSDLLASMAQQWRLIGKSFKGFKNVENYFMTVEIRYNLSTGWHPHYHILTIQKEADNTLQDLVAFWCKDIDALEHVQDIREATSGEIAEYMAKSTMSYDLAKEILNRRKQGKIAYELTASINKKNSPSLHPWELIEQGQGEAFKEYALATKNKQLTKSSRTFWTDCGQPEKTDAELLEQGEKIEETIYKFQKKDWTIIRAKLGEGYILSAAEQRKNIEKKVNKVLADAPEQKEKLKTSVNDAIKPNNKF